jgi:CMP-N-acetylneuraminic acid synthetase
MSIWNKFLGIIPARGGSKRLPGKNSLALANKPLIAWTIEAALKSNLINEVVVTTDNQEIADISIQYGAKVPFIRPEHLSNDTASTTDVVLHTIDFYKNELNQEFEYIILLQPTSPLRTENDIINSIRLLQEKNADAIVSVCPCEHSPLWSNTLPDNLSLKNFIKPEVKGIRSQDLPQFYRLNGAIYICKTERFISEKTFFISENIFAHVMDVQKSIDIDTRIDFELAKILVSNAQAFN